MKSQHSPSIGISILTILVLVGAIVACGAPPEAKLVLATDDNGPITLEQIDRALLGPSANLRSQAGVDLEQVFRTVTRRLAAERILLEEARLVGADQSQEFLERQRTILRLAHTEAHLSKSPAGDPIDEAALRQEWERRRDEFERPERRFVSQIFLRFDGADREPTRQRAEAARQRVIDGEPFGQVAREVSDSETRHQGGRLGAVERGRFSRDFDDLIFDLERGDVSRVVLTRDGAHFFLVDQILDERRPTFPEVAALLRQELVQRRRQETLRNAVEQFGDPANARMLAPERLAQILQGGRATAVVAEVGEQRLTAGQLRDQLRDLQRQLGSQTPGDLALVVAEDWFLREQLFQYLEAEGLPEVDPQLLDEATRQELADHYTRQRLTSWVGERTQDVQEFFELNQARFARPPRLRLTQFQTSLGGDPVQRMSELERSVEALDRGDLDLETLATRLDGEIVEWPLLAPSAIARRNPQAARFATQLDLRQHSPPVQVQQGIQIFRLEERVEAVPQVLSTVRDQVIDMMVETQGPQLLRALFDELLEESGLTFDEQALESAARRLGTAAG